MNKWLNRLLDQIEKDFAGRFDAQKTSALLQVLFDSLLILLAAALVIWVTRRVMRRVNKRLEQINASIAYRRKVETFSSLTFSTIKYAVYIAAVFAILGAWGVNSSSLAFGTAAIGAAVGFGAQGLVQDVITGLSILAEDQLAVGDYVDIGGKAGAVEEVGLRVVKLRDHLGAQHIIYNRNINTVSNFTAGAVQVIIDISLANVDDGPKAKTVAEKVSTDLSSELPFLVHKPVVEGVTQSSTNDIFLRVHLRVLPQQESTINTMFVDRIKRAFAAEKITIPDNQVRAIVISDLFRKAVHKVQAVALPNSPEKLYEGAV